MLEAHYLNKIYPLQDKVLSLFSSAKLKHYLIGRTVLSRVFFNHRYSDDLDFFLNHDTEYEEESDHVDVLTAIKTFPIEKLLTGISWVKKPDNFFLESSINKICFDIASANNNSLFLNKKNNIK